PLAFFHFSGYDPDRPGVLSKHQTRHDLKNHEAMRKLCDTYRQLLLTEGHERTRRRPYAYGTLENGIRTTELIRRYVRKLRKEEIAHPPVSDADAFCRFLMTPNAEVCGADIAPFTRYVL